MIQPPAIKWKGAHPGNYAEDRDGYRPEAIVLHIAEGYLAGMDAWFANPVSGVSAHFGVGKAGEVHAYVNVHDTAFANGKVEPGYTARLIDENPGVNPNKWTISIEHEGRTGETLTPAQWTASTRLSAYLCESVLLPLAGATGFAISRDRILMHRDISPQTRAFCPGWGETYHEAYIARVAAMVLGEPDGLRELLDALTVQANDLDARAQRSEMDAAAFRMQARNLRELVAKHATG